MEDRKFDRDLTPEDIARLQEKIRKEQSAKAKPYEKVTLVDWQTSGQEGEQGFFEKEKSEAEFKKDKPTADYFNSDFFK